MICSDVRMVKMIYVDRHSCNSPFAAAYRATYRSPPTDASAVLVPVLVLVLVLVLSHIQSSR